MSSETEEKDLLKWAMTEDKWDKMLSMMESLGHTQKSLVNKQEEMSQELKSINGRFEQQDQKIEEIQLSLISKITFLPKTSSMRQNSQSWRLITDIRFRKTLPRFRLKKKFSSTSRIKWIRSRPKIFMIASLFWSHSNHFWIQQVFRPKISRLLKKESCWGSSIAKPLFRRIKLQGMKVWNREPKTQVASSAVGRSVALEVLSKMSGQDNNSGQHS